MKRGAAAGFSAGLAAWTGMAGWALLGLTLLAGDADTPALGGASGDGGGISGAPGLDGISATLGIGGAPGLGIGSGLDASAAPAALALAVGGAVQLGPGSVSGLPLGISLIGALLLTAWLTTWEQVASAAAVFIAGLLVVCILPQVQLLPTLVGGLLWLATTLAIRVASWRWPWVRNVALVLLGTAAVATLVGAVLSFTSARMLGTMLLTAPNLLCVALTRGLGVPWHGLELPDLPDLPLWPLALVVAVLVAVFARWHAPWVMALCCAAMAWLGGARVEVFRFEVGLTGDVLIAAATGLAAGGVACLLVEGARHWHRRRT
ncbi:hypothetical protein [Amycolatopsis sp. 195334CR]|uniref:hypothetical protein n=1 Tax=Amycolatopsis sp. 195334CR TaxID=2814588 RepID=UPI001A8F0E91|nr:hypothetical protein [Amycolatopsis sp. 195334CR]MBN6033972.1 hypothetical protein [Amycolatopsis sp. 195334CR]